MDATADSPVNATPSLGQALAAEREKQGLSRADVAQRLHMSAYQVEALESGDYTRLPQGTFLRGFVRNYAKVLGLQPDTMVGLLADGAAAADRRPGIVVPTESIRFDPLGERFGSPYVKAVTIAFVVIALGFAAMYWWLFIRPTPPGAVAHKAASEAVTSSPAPSTDATPAFSSPPPMVAMAPSPPPAAEPVKKAESKAAPEPAKAEAAKKADGLKAAATAPAPAATPKAAQGGNTLKFVFKGPSWVEVRDAKGKLLFSRLNQPGSDAEVSGNPPFNVVVGNAPEVQLFYNDHEFDLEPHTKVAVARFTVE